MLKYDFSPRLRSFWFTLSQFSNHLEIEFLPVVVPTEEEVKDATLYAKRVQQITAE